MKINLTVAQAVITAMTFSAGLSASVFYDTGVTALTLSNPTQLGRLSRNGVIADWSSVEPFPGIINTSTVYHYTSYKLSNLIFPYIQVSVDDISGGNTFVSAYLNSYNPANLQQNYLGDEGSTGNYFGTDPASFQVIVPQGNSLVVVVNDASAANGSIGKSYDVLVEGYSDTNFNEITPEPSQWAMSGIGLSFVCALGYLRSRKQQRGKTL